MKIVFYSWGYPDRGGGISTYVYQMCKALTQCGHRAVVVTDRDGPGQQVEETDSATIHRLYQTKDIRSAGAAAKVLELADSLQADLIEGADHLGECAPLLGMARNIPVMIKVHCSNAVNVLYESEIMFWWQRPLIRLAHLRNIRQLRAERTSIREADILCAPSARLIRELSQQPLAQGRTIGRIPNPFFPSEHPVAKEADIPTILYVGRLCFGKGISYLPAMMQTVWEQVPGCRLVIAGSDSYARGIGSLRVWLTREFSEKAGQVSFLGNVDRKSLQDLYDRSWVVVVPSRWDNFPSVVLEAMSRKKPVVASPHGGMPEMLADTGNRIAEPEKADFGRAVCRFLASQEARIGAGNDGFKRVKEVYAPEKVVDTYISYVAGQL